MAPPEPVLSLSSLEIGYRARRRRRVVLSEVSVALDRGEFACLLGPNGAGKSTLLRTLSRVQPSFAGTVSLDGDELDGLTSEDLARRLAVVLTDRVQIANLSAYELVGLGRFPHTGYFGRLGPEDHTTIEWAMEATQSGHLAHRDVTELSDGERQRVMIARALAQEPKVLLLDEPTAFLDLPSRIELTALLRRLAAERGLAILMTTHDLDLALRTADVLWLITEDGSLESGAPEDLVLNGLLEHAFSSSEVAFDRATGHFTPTPHPGRRARVTGDSLEHHWLRQALLRSGFDVTEDESGDGERKPIVCGVTSEAGDPVDRWWVTTNNEERRFTSLADLTRWLSGQESDAPHAPPATEARPAP